MLLSPRILLAALLVGATPALADDGPVTDITGKWSGKGHVQKDERSRKIDVSCQIEGEQNDNVMAFDGSCRAMLVMKREIGAQLKRDGNSYTGTYKGSNVGIAELDGTRKSPDKVVLEMTFPREVNGDDKAVMTIAHSSDDEFTITTVDDMESGVEVVTSQITFQRESDVAQR